MDFKRHPERLHKYVGGTFINRITDHGECAALRIGKDAWSKHEIATRLGVTHTVACGILSSFCKKNGITSTKHLFEETSPHSLAEHRLGVTTLYVMFAAFADKGLEIDDWYARGEKGAVVTFHTLKHRELEARKREEEDTRKRRRGGRPAGGNGSVSRYLENRV